MRRGLAAVVAALVAGLVISTTSSAGAATIPVGFTDVLVGPVSSPTALAFTPDGRMLVASKGGKLFLARNGTIAAVVAVDVAGASQLTLKVTNAGDDDACDHADWANARLE